MIIKAKKYKENPLIKLTKFKLRIDLKSLVIPQVLHKTSKLSL